MTMRIVILLVLVGIILVAGSRSGPLLRPLS